MKDPLVALNITSTAPQSLNVSWRKLTCSWVGGLGAWTKSAAWGEMKCLKRSAGAWLQWLISLSQKLKDHWREEDSCNPLCWFSPFQKLYLGGACPVVKCWGRFIPLGKLEPWGVFTGGLRILLRSVSSALGICTFIARDHNAYGSWCTVIACCKQSTRLYHS